MFIDRSVARFPGGILTRPEGDIFNALRQPDPTRFHQQMWDFDDIQVVEIQAGTDDNWQLQSTGASTITKSGGFLGGDGGVVGLSTGVVGGNDAQLLRQDNSFTLIPGRRGFFKCRFVFPGFGSVGAVDSEVHIGMVDQGGSFPDDGIFWYGAGGDNFLDVIISSGGNLQDIQLFVGEPLVDNVFYTASFFYDGVGNLTFGFDGLALRTIVIDPATFPSIPLTPSFFIGNDGIAGFSRMEVDYFYIAVER